MPSTTNHALRKTEPDIPAFVDHMRQFNEEAVRIATASMGSKAVKQYARQEWADVLDELEATLKTLRVVTVGDVPSASHRARGFEVGKSAGRLGGAPDVSTALVLDTTEAMVRNGQLVTPAEFQHRMGWASRQAVWKAVDSHRVFYLDYKAERYFPAFYADPAYDRKHLEAVTKMLGDLPGGSKLQFFLARKGSLGGETPLQALAEGRVTKVKDVAAAFAEAPARA